jgi:hypothetical protein
MGLCSDEYCLHDTEISKLEIFEKGFVINFANGVYKTEKGKETQRTHSCNLILTIETFDRDNIYEHLEITRCKRQRCSEIEYDKFLKYLKKDAFKIVDQFCSFFSNSILLKGFIGKQKVEIIFSDIQDTMLQIDCEA